MSNGGVYNIKPLFCSICGRNFIKPKKYNNKKKSICLHCNTAYSTGYKIGYTLGYQKGYNKFKKYKESLKNK